METDPNLEVVDWGQWRIAKLKGTSYANQLQALITSGAADGVAIAGAYGFRRGGSIDFLSSLTGLKAVVVQDPDKDEIDISVLSELSRLQFLVVGAHRQSLDMAKLTDLRELRLAFNAKDRLPLAAQSQLVTLALHYFKSKGRDLTGLGPYRALEILELNLGNTERLMGIDRFKYCRELWDLSGLEKTPVSEVLLQSCKKIMNFEPLGSCENLSTLGINRGGVLENLAFLSGLKQLRDFRLTETDVRDGDLSILMQLPLDHIALLDKRGFSHTEKEIQDQIGRRKARIS
jgi:hypothetical protein